MSAYVVQVIDNDGSVHIYGTPNGSAFRAEHRAAELAEALVADDAEATVLRIESFEVASDGD